MILQQAYPLRKPKLKKTLYPIGALFTIVRTWKQPTQSPLTDEWIKKLWYVYTIEYYSAIKRNTFESVLMRWMNLELIIQSGVSQEEKDKYHILKHMCRIRKMVLKNLLTGQQWRNRHREQTYGHGEKGGDGEMYGKSNIETYITVCKIDSQWEFAVQLRKLKQGLCNLEGLYGQGRGTEPQKGGDIYLPMADSC